MRGNCEGATLVEVVTAMIIGITVFAGLGVAYVYGIDVWQKTAVKMRMQQNGTDAVNEISREICRAEQVQLIDDDLLIRTAPDPLGGGAVREILFSLKDGVIFRNESGKDPIRVIPYDEREDSLRVEVFAVRLLSHIPGEKAVAESLVLSAGSERMVFVNTTVMRNKY